MLSEGMEQNQRANSDDLEAGSGSACVTTGRRDSPKRGRSALIGQIRIRRVNWSRAPHLSRQSDSQSKCLNRSVQCLQGIVLVAFV
jgi:hypothetical protein